MQVAIIGGGMVAETHLRALGELAETLQVRGFYLRDQAKRADFGALAGRILGHNPIAYDSVEAVAADEVDFCLVLTPPDARAEIVQSLAASGKSILMEKPLERTLTAATEIVEICEAHGVTLGTVFQHRMREASRRLTDSLMQGDFGPIAIVEISVPWWRDQSYYDEPGRGTLIRDGGGVLLTQAIHTLDLMLLLTGPVTEVQAMTATTRLHRMETEDFATAGLRFLNGAVGTLTASTALYPGNAETIILHCEAAVVKLCAGVLDINWRDGRQEQDGEITATGGGVDPMAFTHAWHRDLIADFAGALHEGRSPEVSGAEALRVHRLIDALLRSSTEGRTIRLEGME